MWVWDVVDDGEEFECASVLNSHTQDVKCVRWHPTENVSIYLCSIPNVYTYTMHVLYRILFWVRHGVLCIVRWN